jgi:hypothetical protein
MSYHWKPSKSQRKEFAQRMQNDPDYASAYYARQKARIQKRQSSSKFDYENRGGMFVPTLQQHNFCFENLHLFQTREERDAANTVMYGWSCNERVSHDDIHIVNEKMRNHNFNEK